MKILIAEDDLYTRDGLAEVMREEGYDVVTASCGRSALEIFESHRPDCVCLDIMMPEQSGFEVCKKIRAQHPNLPILFISAKSEEVDRLVGFELGADDFISKPFSVREVIARIRAVTRRNMSQQPKPPQAFQMGDLEVLPAELRAKRDSEVIELSLRDVKILEVLHSRPGQPVDRRDLFKHAWGEKYLPSSRTLDQHVSQLRKRVENDPRHPKLIQTVHGVGYRYEPDE
ncbi:response regulator transcription factor [Planctomicrobium sp.]|jgi:DNA-binding response OmpR family regulator|nr:response regulator transcription factor [Planctomicrobium sp.]MDB4743864.1 response regulator transcription factor [Planctomicrobium sp.]